MMLEGRPTLVTGGYRGIAERLGTCPQARVLHADSSVEAEAGIAMRVTAGELLIGTACRGRRRA